MRIILISWANGRSSTSSLRYLKCLKLHLKCQPYCCLVAATGDRLSLRDIVDIVVLERMMFVVELDEHKNMSRHITFTDEFNSRRNEGQQAQIQYVQYSENPCYQNTRFQTFEGLINIGSPRFGGLSDIGSPRVDGPPVMPEDPYAYVVAAFQAPSSTDYVSGPEYPPSPDFVPEPVYPEFMPPEDESDPKEDLEEDDEDLEEDPADYPADGGDNGDDKDESSDDDKDDDAPFAEETEPFETDESAATPPPHPAYRVTARISIRDEPPTPFWSDTEVARLLAIPTPPPSPLSPWSSPLPQIPSPPLPPILSPLPVSPPLPVSSPPPASPIRPLGYRAVMIRLRAEAPSTSHSLPLPPPIILSHTRSDAPSLRTPPLLPIPLPTSSPPLHLLSTDRRADRPEVTLPPRKRLGIALGLRYEGDYAGSREMSVMGSPTLGMRCWQDIDEIYTRFDDEQTERKLMAGRLNMLYRDRCAHASTVRLMEAEAMMSREAWG
ncbi:hypothetical protein Tco_0956552 [Tanacetum coccineum]